jgi:Leucine-rich repeat (LRR) protein
LLSVGSLSLGLLSVWLFSVALLSTGLLSVGLGSVGSVLLSVARQWSSARILEVKRWLQWGHLYRSEFPNRKLIKLCMLQMIKQSKISGKLNLSSLGLQLLPDQIFIYQSSANVSLDKQKDIEWWEVCDLVKLVAVDNLLTQIDPRISTLIALSVLDLRNNRISEIPLLNLDSLSIIHLENNKIHSIVNLMIPSLIELHLQGNAISVLPPTIKNMQKISVLDLSDNRIQELPHEFGLVSSLAKLNLSGNLLCSIDAGMFAYPHIFDLNLSRNRITSISGSSRMPALQIFDIKQNSLKAFTWDLHSCSLKDFCCSGNSIAHFDGSVFRKCATVIESIDLRDNNLKTLPTDFLCLKILKRLDLTNNDLSLLPPELGLLDQLTMLAITGNPLRGYPISNTVKILEFLRNKIVKPPEIESLTFKDPEYVKMPTSINSKVKNGAADMSGLKLERFDFTELSQIGHSISSICLAGNSLTDLPAGFCNIFPNLTLLDLDKNKFGKMPELKLSKLNTLQMSNNLLVSLAFTGDLPKLDRFIANFNKLRTIDFTISVSGLSWLSVANNLIESIDGLGFIRMLPSVAYLDISNNSIARLPPELSLLPIQTLLVVGNTFKIPRTQIVQRGFLV